MQLTIDSEEPLETVLAVISAMYRTHVTVAEPRATEVPEVDLTEGTDDDGVPGEAAEEDGDNQRTPKTRHNV